MSSGSHAARGTISWADRERLGALLRAPAAPWIAMAVLALGTGALLMHDTRGTTIWLDEWTWLLNRRGSALSTYLASHDGHFSAVPVVIYKVLFATAGLRHSWPYRGLMIGEHVVTCVLLFAYARRRVGALLALVATTVILLFGPGWEDLLWSFQITWNTSLLAGVAALLALDRRDLPGDLAACLLLIVSLASSGIGVPIVIGAALEVVLARRGAPRQWWVAWAPVALYVLWALDYQHTVITRHAFEAAPNFIATGLSATFGGLAGLGGNTQIDGRGTLLTWGPVLLVAAVAFAGWRLARLRGVTPRILSLATMLLAFWVITAIARDVLPNPYSSRYLYVSALFVVLLAVELGSETTPPWWLQATIGVVAAVAIISNVGALQSAGRTMRDIGLTTRADLTAAEIGRRVMPRDYFLHEIPGVPFALVPATAYFAAERDVGTPAVTPARLLTFPEAARETADKELIAIHGVSLRPAPAAVRPGVAPVVDRAVGGSTAVQRSCVTFTPQPFTASGATSPYISITVPPSGMTIEATGGSAGVGLRRFGFAFQRLGKLAPAGPATLGIASDGSSQPWHVLLTPTGRVRACGL
jgi:hypothetical protein